MYKQNFQGKSRISYNLLKQLKSNYPLKID